MEIDERSLVIPRSPSGQLYGLLVVAAIDAMPIALLRASLLNRVQDFQIYSIPWWMAVAVLSALSFFLTAVVTFGAADFIRFGRKNAALTIDKNGIILPFTDPSKIISWQNVADYVREEAPYQRNGASVFFM